MPPRRRFHPRFWSAPGYAVMGLSLSMMVSCGSSAKQTGVRVGDETLKQFKAGVTTEAWLVAVLGPPSSMSEVATIPGTFVYRYALGEAPGGIGALFSGQASKNTSVVYFIITDGLVTRYWADRDIERTFLGKPIEQSGEKQGG